MRRHAVVTLVALIAATLLQWYMNTPAPWPPPQWRAHLGSLLGGLKEVVPAALVGFLAGRNGLLLGAIVGLIGRLAVTIPVFMNTEARSSTLVILSHAILGSLGFAVVGAAAGGAGQLLRSKSRS